MLKKYIFLETFSACGLKVGRCRQIIELMKYVSIEGHGHSQMNIITCFFVETTEPF